jgi:hypothetical protein
LRCHYYQGEDHIKLYEGDQERTGQCEEGTGGRAEKMADAKNEAESASRQDMRGDSMKRLLDKERIKLQAFEEKSEIV